MAFMRKQTEPRRGRPRGPRPGLAPAGALARAQTALLDRLPLTTYLASPAWRGALLFVSPQIEALLGYTPAQWLSRPRLWLDRLHPDDRARVIPILIRARAGAERSTVEYRLLDKAGRPRWVRDESWLVTDPGGAPLFIQGSLTDLSESRELGAELDVCRRELRRAQDELEELVSATAHQLFAPLRRIVNLGQVLEARWRALLDEEGLGVLRRMTASAERMQKLVTALGRYAEAGLAAVEPRRVSLDTELDAVLAELRGAIAESGASLTRGPLPEVLATPELARLLLRHLIDNALKFHDEDPPRVSVWAERAGPEWVVAVRDQGPGIPHRQALRVFSVFERAQAGKPGLGLGLAECRRAVQRLGGRIWVESEPGLGSTFRFTLPAADA